MEKLIRNFGIHGYNSNMAEVIDRNKSENLLLHRPTIKLNPRYKRNSHVSYTRGMVQVQRSTPHNHAILRAFVRSPLLRFLVNFPL